MRFNPFNRSGAGGFTRPRLLSLLVAFGAIAAVAISATGAGSAKTVTGHAATAIAVSHEVDGTELAGTLPKVGTPSTGGTITSGQITGQTPTDIFPIINGETCSTETFQFVADQYVPLYYGPTGARPQIDASLSAGEPAKFSDGDTTVKITLKPGLKWSDGTPITGQDVLFDYDLIKAASTASPANFCQYASPTQFPYNVKSISASGNTVTMHLTGKVNPTWFVTNQLQDTNGGLYPLPASDWDVDSTSGAKVTDWATNPKDALAIVTYLQKAGADVSTFASSPLWKVVDGPYKLTSFSATNSSYTLVPNPTYGLSPKARANYDVNTYTSSTAMLNAMLSGSLEIGQIDAGTQLNSIPSLNSKGYSVFGGPSWGWFGGYFNFKDKTNDFDKVIGQTYIRGVFAELADQSAIISHVYHGWAVAAYGPVPTAPSSPFVPSNAAQPAYKYSPTKAVATLKAHGWDVKPGGETTCAKAGTGASECGAGIPVGTPIKFVWANVPESTASTGVLESEAFASEAKAAAGIDVTFQTKTFNFLVSNYNNENPAAKKYYNDWGVNNYGGVNTDYYPTQDGILNTTGALNDGSYDDATANKLMAASIVSPSTSAIKKEVTYLSKSYPIFFFPDQDYITAVSSKVGGSANGFTEMTQQQIDPQQLYVNKK
jgi:peptide/nickel transport system substrate-binding protein